VHDYKKVNKLNPKEALEIYQFSEGVLRFEVTYKRKYILDKGITTRDLYNYNFCLYELKDKFNKLLKFDSLEFMQLDAILKKLLKEYGKRKGMRLFHFYRDYYGNELKQSQIKKHYSRYTIYRNIRDLTQAGIGQNLRSLSKPLDLNIPSEYVINAVNID
jgi:II/X family phage/plasmid replication protein